MEKVADGVILMGEHGDSHPIGKSESRSSIGESESQKVGNRSESRNSIGESQLDRRVAAKSRKESENQSVVGRVGCGRSEARDC